MKADLQIKHDYWEKGFAVLRGAFATEQVDACCADLHRLLATGAQHDPLNLRYETRRTEQGGLVVDRIDPVLDVLPSFARLVTEDTLGRLLAWLLDGPVSVLKSKLIVKRPGTVGYMAHQDFLYWRWLELPPERLCSVAVSLSDAEADSGSLRLFEGLHGSLIDAREHDPNGDLDLARLERAPSQAPVLRRGDAIFFHSLTPHVSSANVSSSDRTLLFSSYAAVSDDKLYKKYYDREVMRRLESYRSGQGREALDRFVRSQESFDSRIA